MLILSFSGAIKQNMCGLYCCQQSNKHWMAITQLCATDARRLFPCWDHPAFKARFALTLQVPSHYQVALVSSPHVLWLYYEAHRVDLQTISNMPIADESRDSEKEWKTVRFATSPPMSTYLLCFVIGEFECLEDSVEGIQV